MALCAPPPSSSSLASCSCGTLLNIRGGNRECLHNYTTLRKIHSKREDKGIIRKLLREQLTDLIAHQKRATASLVPHYERERLERRQKGPVGASNWYTMKDTLEIVENNTVPLSTQQRAIFDIFAGQSIAHIVGHANFKANPLFFVQLARVDHIYPFNFFFAVRRFGKSRVMSLFVGTALLVGPYIKISIYSPGLRASTALVGDTKMYLEGHPDTLEHAVVYNKTTVRLDFGGGDVRQMQGLSGNIAQGKGTGGGLIVVDELTQMSLRYFLEVVTALATVALTTILAISTPKGQENPYTRMIERRKGDVDEKIFNILEFSLACEECKRGGIAVLCEHNEHLQPEWKSKERQRMLAIILEDYPQMYEQEGMGTAGTYTDRCFSDERISNFISNVRKAKDFIEDKLFLSIDLTSGRKSNFAFTSLKIDRSFHIELLGAECVAPGRAEEEVFDQAVEGHIRELSERYFKNNSDLTLTVIIEGNANWTLANGLAFRITKWLKKHAPYSPASIHLYDTSKETGNPFLGVCTHDKMKHAMSQIASAYMGLKKMCVSKDFFTNSKMGKEMILKQLERELAQFRELKTSKGNVIISGKGEDGGMNDDIGMAFLLGVYWAKRHIYELFPAVRASRFKLLPCKK